MSRLVQLCLRSVHHDQGHLPVMKDYHTTPHGLLRGQSSCNGRWSESSCLFYQDALAVCIPCVALQLNLQEQNL